MKAELFVEVGNDLGERAGEGKRFPTAAEVRKRESVPAIRQSSEPRPRSAAFDNEVSASCLDREVRSPSLVEQVEQEVGVAWQRLGHMGLPVEEPPFCQAALTRASSAWEG